MNPLSPLTYYRRHKGRALLLVSLITLATLGLYVMVSILDSIPLRAHTSYLTKVSRIYPAVGNSLEPGVVSQVQTHPDVARVIPDNGLRLSPPIVIGTDNTRLMGVSQDDTQYLMAQCGVRLKEGRMLEPRTNQIMLSEEVVRALGLHIGDQVDRTVNKTYYGAIPAPLVLAGILEHDPSADSGPSVRVGFASYEYLESHESFAPRQSGLLVLARPDRKEAVDEFLETRIASARAETETYREVSRLVAMGRRGIYIIFGIVNCLVAVIVALVVGVINRIAIMQRLEEFGLLNAMGYQKNRLIGRVMWETATVAGIGCVVGLIVAWLALVWLKNSLYYAKGMELDLANWMPIWFVIPIPVAVVAFAAWTIMRVFARLDAVAIIEQGKLGAEAKSYQRTAKSSLVKPLSSRTFYLRHRRRSIMLVATMALMTLGVAFPVFFISAQTDAMKPTFEYLRSVSEVYPGRGNAIDPGVTTQIRNHPAVARVIPTIGIGLQIVVPPGAGTLINLYGVSESDLPVLMEQLNVQLMEGRLPRARSNEIVISKMVALNRGLRVGDKVGQPVQERNGQANLLIEDDIPVEMVVVGTLSRNDLWVGFASLEYLASHEFTASRPVRMLLVPVQRSKAELDAWLEKGVASAQTNVNTYGITHDRYQQGIQSLVLIFIGLESVIAIVAAMALATLNYIFFSERQEEFGILHAMGRSRLWLVLRTAKETGSGVALAWLMGAAVCGLGLVCAQAMLYTPLGLNLNLINPTPWLFTLPIPLVVVAASTGTIARMLSKLDPVSLIERR